MNIITVNDQKFKKTLEKATEGVWFLGNWYKPVILTTEDGVDICEDDDFWSLYTPGYTGAYPAWTLKSRDEQRHLSIWYHDKAIKRFSTKEKAEEYIDKYKPKYEILSFITPNKKIRFKNNNGLFPYNCSNSNDPENRNNEFSEEYLLKDPYYVINSIKRISDGEIFTVGDKYKTSYLKECTIEEIKLNESNSIVFLDHKAQLSCELNCAIKIIEQKFTFGGYEVRCELFSATRVKIVCKGEVGWCEQISNILAHNNKLLPFGNITTKKQTKVSIGCIEGTYEELENIYNYCLKLLK